MTYLIIGPMLYEHNFILQHDFTFMWYKLMSDNVKFSFCMLSPPTAGENWCSWEDFKPVMQSVLSEKQCLKSAYET
jgi:hypothetical protein